MKNILLGITAVVEWLAGLAMIAAPGATITLLLGAPPDNVGLMVGRVLGLAVLSLGIACWGASKSGDTILN